MSFTMLDVLNGDIDNWLIRVRVCRMWKSKNPNTGEEYSLDIILMYEKANKLTISDICLLVILFIILVLFVGHVCCC